MTPAAGPGTSTETAEAGPEGLAPRLPPRERIVKAARDLFYARGVRAVGVDEIAEAAGTNKMTLYRHFASKDGWSPNASRVRQAGRRIVGRPCGRPSGRPARRAQRLARSDDGAHHRGRPLRMRVGERGARAAREGSPGPQGDRGCQMRATRPPGPSCAAQRSSTSPSSSPTNCSCCSKAPASAPRASAATAPPPGSCAWARRSSPRTGGEARCSLCSPDGAQRNPGATSQNPRRRRVLHRPAGRTHAVVSPGFRCAPSGLRFAATPPPSARRCRSGARYSRSRCS